MRLRSPTGSGRIDGDPEVTAILVVNVGSSSLKLRVLDDENEITG